MAASQSTAASVPSSTWHGTRALYKDTRVIYHTIILTVHNCVSPKRANNLTDISDDSLVFAVQPHKAPGDKTALA